MTEEMYKQRRAAIVASIYQHSQRTSDGRLIFPRCLKADYARLDKLDREYGKNTVLQEGDDRR